MDLAAALVPSLPAIPRQVGERAVMPSLLRPRGALILLQPAAGIATALVRGIHRPRVKSLCPKPSSVLCSGWQAGSKKGHQSGRDIADRKHQVDGVITPNRGRWHREMG